MVRLLVVFIFISIQGAFATLPIDIVFDIDQTILTRIQQGPKGDLLADPLNSSKGTLSIAYKDQALDIQNNPVFDLMGGPVMVEQNERYRIYEGLESLMRRLKSEQALGHVRVSFYSGGSVTRNKAILSAIKLSDGSSLIDLAGSRVFGRTDLVPTGKEGRFSERFKKDLTKINPVLDDVVLIEDVKGFASDSQLGNILWMDDRFPYPERLRSTTIVTPEILTRERNKIYWLTDILDEAIKKRLGSNLSFSNIVQIITRNNQITPFSRDQNRRFEDGKIMLGQDESKCGPIRVANILSGLLK